MSPESRRFRALGTNCELFAVDVPAARLAAAERWVQAAHRRLTRFEPTSELSKLNAASGRWVEVSPMLWALLVEALRAYRLSGGLVHAGVLPALVAAGYGRTYEAGPTAVLVDVAPPQPLPEMVELRPGTARLRAGCGVDLGGIAKGWLADRLARMLGESCLVNLGGDLYARGGGPDGRGWPVGWAGRTLLLRDQGAATSGTRGRAWGPGLHHLVDPRTGRPAVTDLVEVSVVAPTAAAAEVHAKTALLLGRAAAPAHLAATCLAWSLA